MAIKRVVIHAGIPKTGTSSIQDTMYENAQLLRQQGLLYLTDWGRNHSMALYCLLSPIFSPYRFVTEDNLTQENLGEFRQTLVRQMLERVKNNPDCHTLVISGEDLSTLDKEAIAAVIPFFTRHLGPVDIEVILYLREPVSLRVSTCQQIVFIPDYLSFAPARREAFPRLFYQFRLQKFFDVFSKTSLRLFKFEDALHHKASLVGHFLQAVGASERLIDQMEVKTSNESRSLESIEFISYLNGKIPFLLGEKPNQLQHPKRAAGDLEAFLSIRGPKFDISHEEKIHFSNCVQEDNQWLRETTGIDYTDAKLPDTRKAETYNQQTIEDFIRVFPHITFPQKEVFLQFFEEKYRQTGEEKFLQLFSESSVPYKDFLFSGAFKTALEQNPELFSVEGVFFNGINTPEYSDRVQLFYDCGRGFTEEDSCGYDRNGCQLVMPVRQSFSKENIHRFRIDPSGYPCAVLLRHLKVNGKEGGCRVQGGNYVWHCNELFYFLQDDPHIELYSDEELRSLEFELIIDQGSYAYTMCNKALFSAQKKTITGPADYAQLFINYGDGYSEEASYKYEKALSQKGLSLQADVSREGVRSFRLDPSVFACTVQIRELRINGQKAACRIQGGNFNWSEKDIFCFLQDDPHIEYYSEQPIRSIQAEIAFLQAGL